MISFIKGFVKGVLLVLLWIYRILIFPFAVVFTSILATMFVLTGLVLNLWDWCNDNKKDIISVKGTLDFPLFMLSSFLCSQKLMKKWEKWCDD